MEIQVPDPDEDRDPHAKTWTFKTGIGKEAVHNILHLENQVLYCWMGIRSGHDCEQFVEALRAEHPLRGLPLADMLHVNAIHSMNFSQLIRTLEIDHGDPAPFTIRNSDICADVFNSIRDSISRKFVVTQGTVSLSSAIQAPVACLTIVVLMGGAISFALWNGKNVTESAKHASIAVTVGLSLLMLGLLAFRALVRPQAEILQVVEG